MEKTIDNLEELRTSLKILRSKIVQGEMRFGMCHLIERLYWTNYLSQKQHHVLTTLIEEEIRQYSLPKYQAWWKPGYGTPRIKWIDEKLNNL